MRAPEIVTRHPALRWLVPLVVVGLAAAVVTTAVSSRSSHPKALPTTSPAALVSAIRSSSTTDYSGTIVAQVSLGLPEVVRRAALASDPDDMPLEDLLDGSHSMRVWSNGSNQQRLSVLGDTAEVDVVRDHGDLWEWNSTSRIALHSNDEPANMPLPVVLLTPDELVPPRLAARLVDVLADSADMTLRQGDDVADRQTYELILTPHVSGSRLASVHVEVDGQSHLPLGVQVYASAAAGPAVDVSFTSVSYRAPAPSVFAAPPPGETSRSATIAVATSATSSGSGWLSVVSYPNPAGAPVKRRTLTSPLLSALVTRAGIVYVGTVEPSVLQDAAQR